MKILSLILLCCVDHLAAADLKSQIDEFGPCKEVVLTGNVLWNADKPEEAINFHASASPQIELIMRWIGAISAVERPVRYHGERPNLSTPEVLQFELTFRNGSRHQVAIYGKRIIFIDNDRSFRTDGDVDLRLLFSAMKDSK